MRLWLLSCCAPGLVLPKMVWTNWGWKVVSEQGLWDAQAWLHTYTHAEGPECGQETEANARAHCV